MALGLPRLGKVIQAKVKNVFSVCIVILDQLICEYVLNSLMLSQHQNVIVFFVHLNGVYDVFLKYVIAILIVNCLLTLD